jgi:hypothetical protein
MSENEILFADRLYAEAIEPTKLRAALLASPSELIIFIKTVPSL